MQFTRLRLNGFKSFVDPTDLVIAPGLTGVVGPNGCGKSNLLEALRWVMGENRPTAMRGGGMEDVIFAGAASRPARNFAEVSLAVDNADRRAPAAFNDADMIEVTRRITREAGSAFKCNAKDVRARDVQMLFADAATGSHSPALVRQGQISELINAKPKARRRVLEDAAGISGLYQRRHEAELKLRATEANLERVDDTLEQLAGQLAQLARQAKQAARYRTIAAELRMAEWHLLWARWAEAEDARAAAQATLSEARNAASRAEAAMRSTSGDRETAEAALPPLREEAAIAGALVQRLSVERDTQDAEEQRAKDLIGRLRGRRDQLAKDRDREAGLTGDATATIARLDAEAADLQSADEGQDDRLAAAQAEADDAAQVLADREAALSDLTQKVADQVARKQGLDRDLADARKALSRHESEAETARRQLAEIRSTAEAQRQAQTAAEQAQADATAALQAAEAGLATAEAERTTAQGAEGTARSDRSDADGAVKALTAEVTGLRKLVAQSGKAGSGLLDETEAESGFERALGAALGDDLNAPRAGDGGTGWAALAAYDAPEALPEGADPLGAMVTVPAEIARRIGQVGVVQADDGARLQARLAPGQRLVSTAGDLWRWDGYRAAAADAPSAAALRLEQRNRLADLETQAAAAETRARDATEAHTTAKTALDAANAAEAGARDARRKAEAGVTEAARAVAKAETDRNRAETRLEALSQEADRQEMAAAEARERVATAEKAHAQLGDVEAARQEAADVRTNVEAARMTMMARRSAAEEIAREGKARTDRLATIAKDRAGWADRLANADDRIGDLDRRLERTIAELQEAEAAPPKLEAKRADLVTRITEAEARQAKADDAVAQAEATLKAASAAEREAVAAASEAREAFARAETREDASAQAVAEALKRIDDDTGKTPDALREGLDRDDPRATSLDAIEAEITRLTRSRDSLGAVNLRAEKDAEEIRAEHTNLETEKADLDQACAKLRGGIASLNKEGRERLLAAFETVNQGFSNLFTHLFGGGEARLELIESDDPLEAGLEILCQPPGKKLAALSLLSGGEQTLTALALIFAVFQSNPAPVCVLDEVDAPLDDMNVTRFCDLLDEMTRRTNTRFLVITHHAVTMSRMERLFGVTMAEQGVSQLVSVDLKRAEAMVA